MRATLLTAAIALAAAEALAADMLTKDEIAKLPFMAALAYAEAIDANCLRDWHYASTALALLQSRKRISSTNRIPASSRRGKT